MSAPKQRFGFQALGPRDEVEKARTREEEKGLIERASMELEDEKLDQVVGGSSSEQFFCNKCRNYIHESHWHDHMSTCWGLL